MLNLPSDTDDKSQFGCSWNIEVSSLLGITSQPDLITLLSPVFLDVLLSTLEDLHTPCPTSLQVLQNK